MRGRQHQRNVGVQFCEARNTWHQPQAGKAGAAVHVQGVLHAMAQIFGGGVDGPQSAGYVRLGDSLVPAVMGTGDRMTMSQSVWGTGNNYPLSA